MSNAPLAVGRSAQSSLPNQQLLEKIATLPELAGLTAGVKLKLPPDKLDRLAARASVAEARGDLTSAERLIRRVWNAAPSHPVPAMALGSFLLRNGRPARAIGVLKRALELMPPELTEQEATARAALGIAMLATGDYSREAWAHHESRFGVDRYAAKTWDGRDLSGARLLILSEQGLGDQIQFARFVPMLQAAGAQVILTCAEPLRRLFHRTLGVRVVPPTGWRVVRESIKADYWVFTMSLAHRLGITLENLPAARYLSAAQARTPRGARIGVVAKGSPDHEFDQHRSLPDDLSRELLALDGAVSLLPEDTGAKNFDETAEIIAGLDLVITVDTSVAHLAGAMGKPVWILLSATATDWRWMQRRTDSPWYPSAKLYRQEKPGDWVSVIERVKRDLSVSRLDCLGARIRSRSDRGLST